MERNWWRGAVMYQVYPRSFLDTDGDGTGDLKGVTEKLDYIAALGVDGIWLSPCFASPMKDFGYDISDYLTIDPLFGTLEDFDAMLGKAHRLGLKLIVDQVYSHTSDCHAWFAESRQSRDNEKTDWYVWADPNPDRADGLPNNWVSVFGGPAWEWCAERGQFYYHQFLKEQPDLNFHCRAVQDAVLDMARFWLDRGVDGFRLDAINHCFHDAKLRDNPPKAGQGRFASQLELEDDPYNLQRHLYDKSQPEMLDFLVQLRRLADDYPGSFLLGEIGDDEPMRLAALYTAGTDRLHTAYNFSLMAGSRKKLTAPYIRGVIEEQMAQEGGGWPSWAFSNHDVVRSVTRFSAEEGKADPALARLLIALLVSLRGTAFLYQGEELGLPEARIPEDIAPDEMQDPWGIALYPRSLGRDGCRTPMPWDGEMPQAGFTAAARPWLPIPDSHLALSVAAQEADPASPLHFTRLFLDWRKEQPALIEGDIAFEETGDDRILTFTRATPAQQVHCVFNLSPESVVYDGEELPPYGFTFDS